MLRTLIVLTLLVAIALEVPCQTISKAPTGEQTHFSAEDGVVQSPVTIPDDAWAFLAKVREAKRYKDDGKVQDDPKRDWFSAAVVHLQNASRSDLVVAGVGPLAGANIQTFWVFLGTPAGMHLVLTAGVHDLIILPYRHHGVRDVELVSATCCQLTITVLWYELGKYRVHKQVTKNL